MPLPSRKALSGVPEELVQASLETGLLRPKTLPLRAPPFDRTLPDGGLPRGAVLEVASAKGLARATTFALSACAAAQADARLGGERGTMGAFCAWVDAGRTLFAPAVSRAGVDLGRLLVVRPDPADVGRIALRLASSRAFGLVVVDLAGVPGAALRTKLDRWPTVVRRLALAVQESDTAVLLLTDSLATRPLPLPVATRLELERPAEERVLMRIAKDRQGRVTAPVSVALPVLAAAPKIA